MTAQMREHRVRTAVSPVVPVVSKADGPVQVATHGLRALVWAAAGWRRPSRSPSADFLPAGLAEASFGDLIILPRRDGAGTHVPPNTMVQVGAIEGH